MGSIYILAARKVFHEARLGEGDKFNKRGLKLETPNADYSQLNSI